MLILGTKDIIKTFEAAKPVIVWSFKDVTRAETTALTHSYHRYPAKFIPNIVEKLINDFTKEDDFVLDPFGGCGTTLVESKRLGRRSLCFDINPVAKFITEVKVTPINPIKLDEEFEKLQNKLLKNKKIFYNYHLKNERILYWFDKKIITELDFLYSKIKSIKNAKIRKFFLCAFSHNLKNSSKWLMKSIKPTIDKDKKIPPVSINFLKHSRSMIKKNGQFYSLLQKNNSLKTSAKVLLKDSTKRFSLNDEVVDLIITSPPYVTSYEYADLHQLSLLWFGSDRNNFSGWYNFSSNLKDFRKKFIGTSYKTEQEGEIGSQIGLTITKRLGEKDKALAKDVSNYFIDMNLAFKEMYRVLKIGKHACIVIGNTELRGVAILNAEVATEQMLKIGFKNPNIIKREVQNKMITPWRDTNTGKFTNIKNPNKKCAYEYEYVLIMEK
ncbi:MAG: DNA methyltransferase [Patescibacteria group bacterium]|nr:DNA methyltransferase [Patescibacteria group bacterium]